MPTPLDVAKNGEAHLQDAASAAASIWRAVSLVSVGSLIVLLLVSGVFSVVHSQAITSVTVRYKGAESEHRDKKVPFVDSPDALPDYRLEIVGTDGRRHLLGTHVNSSAAEPLVWLVQEPYVLRRAASLRLTDEDKVVSDVLEEVQISSISFEGAQYAYTLKVTRTFGAGMAYFFSTPLGMAIAIAVGLAVFLAIAGAIAG